MFYGWRVVGVCFVAAVFTWGLGVFGGSVYLAEIRSAHGWPTALVSSALTVFYLTNALSLPAVGWVIGRWGPRPVIATGALLLAAGVAGVGRLEAECGTLQGELHILESEVRSCEEGCASP